MNPQRAQRKIQLVLNYDQVRFRLGLVFLYELPHRDATQVHERFRLGQQHRLIRDHGPHRQRPALPVSYIQPQASRDSINRQKAQVMRRELVLDTRISESDDQFHATIPIRVGPGV